LKLAASLNIPHFAEVSAKTRQGFETFFDFIKELADPWGSKKLTADGELYDVWHTLPPPPPPPTVSCGTSTLWTDFARLLWDAPFSDVRLRVCERNVVSQKPKNEKHTSTSSIVVDNSYDICAHRIVLASASPICDALMSGQWSVNSILADLILHVEEITTPVRILIITFQPSITRTVLWALIEFIYTGTIQFSEFNRDMVAQLHNLATKLQIVTLAQLCHNTLNSNNNNNNNKLNFNPTLTCSSSARQSLLQHLHHQCSFLTKTPYTDLTIRVGGLSLHSFSSLFSLLSSPLLLFFLSDILFRLFLIE
jgi:hypothetical protein